MGELYAKTELETALGELYAKTLPFGEYYMLSGNERRSGGQTLVQFAYIGNTKQKVRIDSQS